MIKTLSLSGVYNTQIFNIVHDGLKRDSQTIVLNGYLKRNKSYTSIASRSSEACSTITVVVVVSSVTHSVVLARTRRARVVLCKMVYKRFDGVLVRRVYGCSFQLFLFLHPVK